MNNTRLPRFNRIPPVAPITLTDRDRQIIRLVHRHRFLRSSHIHALIGGSFQSLQRRLQILFHHGYLERPRTQLEYYHQGGSKPIVYGLGNKGGRLVQKETGGVFHPIPWGEKNRGVGRIFLQHALITSDIMVGIELSCRKHGIRLVHQDELAPKGQTFRWNVRINGGLKLGIMPDRVFALEYPDTPSNRTCFFLEADRGTMPVKRSKLFRTSFYRKLLAYTETWEQDLHRSLFGFHRFRVLTVTSSPERVQSLVDVCSKLKRGHGLFLFADPSILSSDILTFPCQTGNPGKSSTLLD